MKPVRISLVVSFILVVCFNHAFSGVPQMINYQGKLTTAGGGCLNDTVQMTFTIYADSFATTIEWTEIQNGVVVKEGIFNVLLGGVNLIPSAIFNGNIKYLGVRVEADPEMRPLKPMVSVAYAIKSSKADTADYAQTSLPVPDGDWIFSGDDIYHLVGNVGIGTSAPNEQLEITGNLKLPATTATAGIIKMGPDRFIHSYGVANTFIGKNAGNLSMTGEYNIANGFGALQANTTGSANTASGAGALYSNTTGYYNTANGTDALHFNTEGNYNTANGTDALHFNTTGYQNTANGAYSLRSNTDGRWNTANGVYALYNNTTGSSNTANGFNALYANTTGSCNTANGVHTLYSNTTGFFNTANGDGALYNNTTGYQNTANGVSALYSNTTGHNNTANGLDALYFNTTGHNNTANGIEALHFNTEGYCNTANGVGALYNNTEGYWNTANGLNALYFNTEGYWNTANGTDALHGNTTGTCNTALGYGADVSLGNLSNATAIGFNAVVDASNKVKVGNSAVTSIGGQVGWTTFSDGRYKKNISQDVPGLTFISKLKPITYTMNMDAIDAVLRPPLKPPEGQSENDFEPGAEEIEAKQAQSQIVYTGFIAQEVEKAAQEVGYDFSGVDTPKSDKGTYGLRYAEFVVPLVKAVQEQQQMIKDLQKRIEELEKKIK